MLNTISKRIHVRSTDRLSAKSYRPLIEMLDSSDTLFNYDTGRCRNGRDPKFSAVNMMTVLLYMETKWMTLAEFRQNTTGPGGQVVLGNLGMPKGPDGRYLCPSDGWISDFRNHEYPIFRHDFETELRDMVLKNAGADEFVVTIDSTPAEASRYSSWDYNLHYGIRMAKAHIVMADGTPVCWTFTDGNVGDNPQYIKMLEDSNLDCVRGAKIYADGGYNSFQTYAETFMRTGAVMYGNPGANAAIHEEASWKNILKRYNRLHSEWDFVSSSRTSGAFILRFLCNHGESEIVGKFLRNLDIRRGSEIRRKASLSRHVCETVHHAMKRWVALDVRGLCARYAERRICLRIAFCAMLTLLFRPYI